MKHWILQANPRRYRLFDALRDGYEISSWNVAQLRDEIAPGDEFALWLSGENRGVYALGVVTEPAEYRQDDDPYWTDPAEASTPTLQVGIRLSQTLIDRPVLSKDLAQDPRFATALILRMPGGRNPFRLTEDEWRAIVSRCPPNTAAAGREAAPSRAGWQDGRPRPDIGRSELTEPVNETGRDNPFRRAIHVVLAAAPRYSRTATPAMRRRDGALADMVARLDEVLPELARGLGLASLGLRAGRGGHQASYSPTAWVRIYAPDYSPRAMEGFYIAYLFTTDGSAVYLSLMQGTSEYRSGAMRPVNDRAELRARAAEARRSLGDFEGTPLMRTTTVAMDLTWASTPQVGPESRRRTRNYEDANIIALRYPAGTVPPDADLLQDLSDMLPLLATLYQQPQDPLPAEPAPDEAPPAEPGRIAKRTRQRERDNELDQAVRTALEKFAEDAAERILGPDWKVERVGHLHRGYDLDCYHRPTGRILHVEVKGTQTPGEEVVLTRNEVRHHRAHGGDCPAEHALFVLSKVEVTRTPVVSCAGGTPFLRWDWSPEGDALDPTEYTYRVPREPEAIT